MNRRFWMYCIISACFAAGIGVFVPPPVDARVWHVCMECDSGDARTIGEALRQAEPRDTILVYWEPRFPYYMESLVIDKPVRIISHPAAADLINYDLFPVLTATEDVIVRITVPGVELIGFNIMFLEKPAVPDVPGDFDPHVGIWLEAPAVIRQCAVTNCTTGIVAAYSRMAAPGGSRIQMCRIGLPPDHGLNRRGLRQTRNLIGMVLMGARNGSGFPVGSGSDSISNCQIMRNHFYGVVYTLKNPPVMDGNLVEMNGTAPFRIARSTLDSSGNLVWADAASPKPETSPATPLVTPEAPPCPAVPSPEPATGADGSK